MSGAGVLNFARGVWRRCQGIFPVSGFYFDRPILLLQSDDWGRVGLRDGEGMEQLRAVGLTIGERPYDFYTLETADDLAALREMLKGHRDCTGRHPCLEMNFVVANLDFAKMKDSDWQQIHLMTLAEGLPRGWSRPGLVEGYRQGIADGVFLPALHGTTHFSRPAVERWMHAADERTNLLRRLWQAGTPYIYWRMPWIGYEYWDPENNQRGGFLSADQQQQLIGSAAESFAKLFSRLPRSACAPGYRADSNTNRAWREHSIQISQNGPGTTAPPYLDRSGRLHLTRSVEFEPATDAAFTVEACVQQAESCFARGLPAIVSLHSINFHSTVRDFRTPTLELLDEFLTTVEAAHPDLLYLHDEDLYALVSGSIQKPEIEGRVRVTRKKSHTERVGNGRVC